MIDNTIKLVMSLLFSVCLFGFSTLANADDLKMSNASKHDLSFMVHGLCSQNLGTLEKRSMKVVSEEKINDDCKHNQMSCKIEVFASANCLGQRVAIVTLDTKEGIKEVYVPGGNTIAVSANGFNLFFEGPWLKK